MRKKKFHPGTWIAAFTSAILVLLCMALGSRAFRDFDPELLLYAAGTVLAAGAVGYRFAFWAQRPPTRLYWKRGLQLLLRRQNLLQETALHTHPTHRLGLVPSRQKTPLPSGPGILARELPLNFVGQNFIRRRSLYRWTMHLCLSGGCTLAFAITFPLVLGWIHFEMPQPDAGMYQVVLFGWVVDAFSIGSWKAFMIFNMLNFSAFVVMAGLIMAAWRRLAHAGERATQTFAEDILPLILIFAVTATGLMLTASYKLMGGWGHSYLAVVHLISVLALLFYIPFGKLFHMFQRILALFVSLYKRHGSEGPQAHCRRCDQSFASQMHLEDLKRVLDHLRFDYGFATGKGSSMHYQNICPACRRRAFAVRQGRSLNR